MRPTNHHSGSCRCCDQHHILAMFIYLWNISLFWVWKKPQKQVESAAFSLFCLLFLGHRPLFVVLLDDVCVCVCFLFVCEISLWFTNEESGKNKTLPFVYSSPRWCLAVHGRSLDTMVSVIRFELYGENPVAWEVGGGGGRGAIWHYIS